MVSYRRRGGSFDEYAHGHDWHTNHSDAIGRADDMREAKLRALTKQIKRLEALDMSKEVAP